MPCYSRFQNCRRSQLLSIFIFKDSFHDQIIIWNLELPRSKTAKFPGKSPVSIAQLIVLKIPARSSRCSLTPTCSLTHAHCINKWENKTPVTTCWVINPKAWIVCLQKRIAGGSGRLFPSQRTWSWPWPGTQYTLIF